MTAIKFYGVGSAGPEPLPITGEMTYIHDLFTNLPTGVYTAFGTFEHNKFLCLEDHIDRLANSIAMSGWSYELDRMAIRRALHEICTDTLWPNSRVRIDFLPQPVPQLGTESKILIALAPFSPIPEAIYKQGVSTVVARKLVREEPLIKKAGFVPERQSVLESNPSAYECLLVDQAGRILEGTTSNFYAVRRGELWTAGSGVLEGVARRLVLKVVNDLGIKLHLEAVGLDDLSRLEEAAISSSSRAIIPVVRIEDYIIGDGRPGPVTKRLLAAYNARASRMIKTAI